MVGYELLLRMSHNQQCFWNQTNIKEHFVFVLLFFISEYVHIVIRKTNGQEIKNRIAIIICLHKYMLCLQICLLSIWFSVLNNKKKWQYQWLHIYIKFSEV